MGRFWSKNGYNFPYPRLLRVKVVFSFYFCIGFLFLPLSHTSFSINSSFCLVHIISFVLYHFLPFSFSISPHCLCIIFNRRFPSYFVVSPLLYAPSLFLFVLYSFNVFLLYVLGLFFSSPPYVLSLFLFVFY